MTFVTKWAEKRERPKFSDRLGLAQPLLAAAGLTLISLALGLPILYLLNTALSADVAPASLMDTFQIGALFTKAAAWLDGPLVVLVNTNGGLSFGGLLFVTLAFALLTWGMAMMLLSQWRAQLPVMEEASYLRLMPAILLTLIAMPIFFWLVRLAGPSAQAAQATLVLLLHVGFAFFLLLAWYGGLSGNFFSWRALLIVAALTATALTAFVWILGALVPQKGDGLAGFTIAVFVLLHLLGFWLIVVLGVHMLARQTLAHTDWQDLDELTRGQQVDFALAIMKTLGHADNHSRWMGGQAIAQRLGSNHAITVQTLKRLTEFDLVRASQTANRPDHWRLSTESLHAVNLQDLMEAFGATLDPSGGVYEEGPQPAMLDLADQEKRVFRTDLASLTRGDRSPALTSDGPAFLSLLSDKGVGTQTDAAGAPPPVREGDKAYERLTSLLEKEAGTSRIAVSQLNDDSLSNTPAFAHPPRPDMSRTKAAALEMEEDVEDYLKENHRDGEDQDIKAIAAGLSDIVKAKPAEEKEDEEIKKEPKPIVVTGLSGLLTDLPENLGSYTLALVSPKP